MEFAFLTGLLVGIAATYFAIKHAAEDAINAALRLGVLGTQNRFYALAAKAEGAEEKMALMRSAALVGEFDDELMKGPK